MDQDSTTTPLAADDVIDYLAANPDFFHRHPEALDELKISHTGDGAVSLVERQVAVLRERNAELRRRYDQLMERAEQNDVLLSATQDVISAIAARGNHEDIAPLFTSLIEKHFNTDFAAFHPVSTETSTPATKIALHLLGNKAACSGPVRAHELQALFGQEHEGGSAAIAKLVTKTGQSAFIAVGSPDVGRYGMNDGTVFLEYLANVIAHLPITMSTD